MVNDAVSYNAKAGKRIAPSRLICFTNMALIAVLEVLLDGVFEE